MQRIAQTANATCVDHQITGTLESVERLAMALGDDLGSPELTTAKSRQRGAWDIDCVPSHQGFTPIIERRTELIRGADPGITG